MVSDGDDVHWVYGCTCDAGESAFIDTIDTFSGYRQGRIIITEKITTVSSHNLTLFCYLLSEDDKFCLHIKVVKALVIELNINKGKVKFPLTADNFRK